MQDQNWPIFKVGDVVELVEGQCKAPEVLKFCNPGDKYVVEKFDSYNQFVTFTNKNGEKTVFSSHRFKLSEKTYPFGQDPNKKYTYDGFPARLICTDRKHEHCLVWVYDAGDDEWVFTTNSEGENDVMEVLEVQPKPETDWSKVPVDTLVYIQNKKTKTAYRRYFAGLDPKLGCTIFQWGTTSATSENKPAPLNSDCEISLEPFDD